MTTYTDSKGAPIQLGKELGRGGEGIVYATDRNGMVAKILHDNKLQEEPLRRAKLECMMTNIPGEIFTPKSATTSRRINIAWPTSLILQNGQFCGYMMPKITRSNELNIIINPANRTRQKLTLNTYDLYRIAHNVCTVYRVFHEKNYVIGDINTKNIMVNTEMQITVVDCDSIQVRDQRTNQLFPCKVGVPEYTAPELVGTTLATVERTPNHDGFSIAVLVFQLLMQGYHPFGGIQTPSEPYADDVVFYNMQHGIFPFDRASQHRCTPPPRAPDYEAVIPAPIQALFRQAFLTKVRPTAAEWTTALKSVMDSFVTCAHDSTHRHPQGSSCTFCSGVSRVASATTGILITTQPKTRSKKKTATTSPVPTVQSTNWGEMWWGVLPVVLSIIALYLLPGDQQLRALTWLYVYQFWPLLGTVALFIGIFARGVRTNAWGWSIGIGLSSLVVVTLYGLMKGLNWILDELLKLYAQSFGLFLGVIVVAVLAVALLYALITSDWGSFGVVVILSVLVAVVYGLYLLYMLYFWWLMGGIAIALLLFAYIYADGTQDWRAFVAIGSLYILGVVVYGLFFLYTQYFWWLMGGIVLALLSGGGIMLKRRSTG